jgi:transposase-like protein
MPRGKEFNAEQIIGKLREAEVGLAQGKTLPEVVRKLGATEQTYYRWKREHGGLRTDQVKRLQAVEHVRDTLGRDMVTERRACRVLGQAHPARLSSLGAAPCEGADNSNEGYTASPARQKVSGKGYGMPEWHERAATASAMTRHSRAWRSVGMLTGVSATRGRSATLLAARTRPSMTLMSSI